MRTDYHIDRYQETYFVIDDFEELFAATRADFAPIYCELDALTEITPDEAADGDREYGAFGQKERAAREHGPSLGRKRDRKSTRLNSSHVSISYAVFCLKKKKKKKNKQ